MYTAARFSSFAALLRTSSKSSSLCCLVSVEPRSKASIDEEELIELSTTTPTGLNHNILPSVFILSSSAKNEPTPPRIENVITTKTIAVNVFNNIFLVKVKNLSALDHKDCALFIKFSKRGP